jgi:hypothetical protein
MLATPLLKDRSGALGAIESLSAVLLIVERVAAIREELLLS